jgi:hypothetical protein
MVRAFSAGVANHQHCLRRTKSASKQHLVKNMNDHAFICTFETMATATQRAGEIEMGKLSSFRGEAELAPSRSSWER